MREIKFRANIKWAREIYEVQSLYLEDEYVILTVWEFNEGKTIIKKLSEINLMQYTWLKDKNWKEIYEGDIVNNELNPKWFEIEWSKYWWFDFFCDWRYSQDWKDWEIIWNIYENKDLLNND